MRRDYRPIGSSTWRVTAREWARHAQAQEDPDAAQTARRIAARYARIASFTRLAETAIHNNPFSDT